jgi:8-oxo-dGTP pyrophosphatase MutT (NUDIX family)
VAEWRERIRGVLLREPDHRPASWRLGGSHDNVPDAMRDSLELTLQPAAVLVPVLEVAGEPQLLLTVRASHLRQHAGQVSFPGGRPNAADADLCATALREAAEEVGLAQEFVEPLGYLGDQVVLTGYRITPVVGWVRAGFELATDAGEVAQHFLLPLARVLDAHSFRRKVRQLQHVSITGYEIEWQGHRIWGATAGILRRLRETLVGVGDDQVGAGDE